MNKLSEFIRENKDLCYTVAERNTKKNEYNKPIIAKNDEWIKEKEWDELFLKKKGE